MGVDWGCRFAEMSELDKNKISHRYRALEKLTAFLKLQAETPN